MGNDSDRQDADPTHNFDPELVCSGRLEIVQTFLSAHGKSNNIISAAAPATISSVCSSLTAATSLVPFKSTSLGSSLIATLGSLFRKVFNALETRSLLFFDVAEISLDRGRKPTLFEGEDWASLVRFGYDEMKNRPTRHITTFRKVGDLFRPPREQHDLQLDEAKRAADRLRKAGFRGQTVRKFGSHPLLPKRVITLEPADSTSTR